jgi:hypothetical protein
MEALTGVPAERNTFGWFCSYDAAQLQKDLAAGKLVVLESRPGLDAPNAYSLEASHAYQVVGVEQQNGTLCMKLHNPWNKDQPALVPCDELTTWFAAIDVGSTD